ncbi:1-acyl-sn-glycerol-3-phosphate acyltransferase [Apibacter sp. HY039]|uniref:lysophospholipid acyltransferase family protein n=1 Tax=Apibacter sp. HY039 TaxID=2501476 RepID=UPI0021084655|nr:lysophospholipid acyltransferase family protein [Apibacter sp. HY039]
MEFIRKILVIIWKIWFYILAALCTLFIGTTIYLLTYQKNDKLTYFFMRLWSYVLFYGMGFTYTLKYSQKLDPKKNYILVSNHTSVMDVALMFILHPNHPIVFVGKKELERYPVFGRIFKKISISVDRSDKKSRADVFPAVKKTITMENKNVVLFPEGGVPDRDTILANFKDGAFISSLYCNAPIVVYAIHNLNNMFPFVFTLGYPGKVKVERLDILYPLNKSKEELKDQTYHLIYEQIKDTPIIHPELK